MEEGRQLLEQSKPNVSKNTTSNGYNPATQSGQTSQLGSIIPSSKRALPQVQKTKPPPTPSETQTGTNTEKTIKIDPNKDDREDIGWDFDDFDDM